MHVRTNYLCNCTICRLAQNKLSKSFQSLSYLQQHRDSGQKNSLYHRARAHWPLCSTTSGRVFVAGIIPVGNHYFEALASTLQFVAQVCDRLWLIPTTDKAFAYITYMSPPHVALVCSGPLQSAATCG